MSDKRVDPTIEENDYDEIIDLLMTDERVRSTFKY